MIGGERGGCGDVLRRWPVVAAAATLLLFAGAGLLRLDGRSSRLASIVAELDRTDPGWRLADPSPGRAAIPDAENGAVVLGEAAAMLPEAWPPHRAGEDGPGVVDVLKRLYRGDDPRRLDEASARALREEAARVRGSSEVALRLVGFARGRRVKLANPEPLEDEANAATASFRVSRLLEVAAIVAALDGRPDEAIEACRARLGVSRAIGDEPSQLAQYARLSAVAGAARSARDALALGEPSSDVLAPLQRELLAERGTSFAREALRGQRADVFKAYGDLAAAQGAWSILGATYTAQRASALEWSNDLLAVVARPEPEWTPAVRAWELRAEAMKRRPLARFAAPWFFVDGLPEVVGATLRTRAEAGAVAILIAAERHRLAAGAWPGSLADIPADLLPEPPLDPYTGGAYRLARDGEGFRAYSVGPNLKDEGGACEGSKRVRTAPRTTWWRSGMTRPFASDVRSRRRPTMTRRRRRERRRDREATDPDGPHHTMGGDCGGGADRRGPVVGRTSGQRRPPGGDRRGRSGRPRLAAGRPAGGARVDARRGERRDPRRPGRGDDPRLLAPRADARGGGPRAHPARGVRTRDASRGPRPARRRRPRRPARRATGFARGRNEFVLGANVIDSEHGEAKAVRQVARLLRADAIVAAHDGRPDDAIRACRAMLGVARSIGDEPTVIPQLIRGAIDRAAARTIVATLARAEPSADALADAQRDILAALAEPVERHALRGERAVVFEMYERPKEDPNQFSFDQDGERRPPMPGFVAAAWAPIAAGQQALALGWLNELAAAAELNEPDRLRAVGAWRARFQARKASRVGSLTGRIAILLMPGVDRSFDGFAARRAYLGAAAVLLAAERHRRAAGARPAAIAEIPADLLPEPPSDPYTGGPYRLARFDGGLRVDSVGPNLEDEGGACEPGRDGEDGAADDEARSAATRNFGAATPILDPNDAGSPGRLGRTAPRAAHRAAAPPSPKKGKIRSRSARSGWQPYSQTWNASAAWTALPRSGPRSSTSLSRKRSAAEP